MSRARLKVCVLGARGVPGVSGGVEAHCEALYPLLAKQADVDVVLLARKGYVQRQHYLFKGVEVVATNAPRHRYFEAFVHTLTGVVNARFAQKADIVHFHAIGPALMAPLAKLLGMKVIVTHHSRNYLHRKWNKFARRVLRFGEWSAVRFADRVITVSHSMAVEMRERYRATEETVVYIPNGAPRFETKPTEKEQQEVLKKFGLTPGRYMLGVGRLTPEKGFDDLVAAFKKASTDMVLVIVGKADFEDSYSRALTAQAGKRVIFAGFQDRRTLYSLYKNAGLFVLPSHHEGMPIAALEALSVDAPILMSDIGPNLDLGLPPAHYFPAGNVNALAARLGANPETYRFEASAMLRRFQWDEIARQTSVLYDELTLPRADRTAPSLSSTDG